MPITSLIFQLGGVGFDEYVRVALVTAAAVATYGMVGIAVSVRSNKSMSALTKAVGLVLIWVLFSGWLVLMVGSLISQLSMGLVDMRNLMELSSILSPVYSLAMSDTRMGFSSGVSQSMLTSPLFIGHLAFQACVFLGALFIAWRAFAHGELIKPIKNVKAISNKKELRKRKLGFPFYLIDPLRAPFSIRDNQDALVVKERRVGGGAGRNLTALIRMCYLGLAISLMIFWIPLQTDSVDFTQVMSYIVIGFAPLLTFSMTATLITREREGSTFDQLLTLPVSEWRIVWSKFRSSLRAPLVVVLSFMPLPYILFFLFKDEKLGLLTETLKRTPFVLSYVILFSAVAIFFSAICRRNVTAVISAFLAIGLMNLCPMLMIGLYEIINHGIWHELGVDQIVALATQVIGPFVSPYYSLQTALHDWEDLTPATGWGYILAEAAGVVLLSLGFLRAAAWRMALRRDG